MTDAPSTEHVPEPSRDPACPGSSHGSMSPNGPVQARIARGRLLVGPLALASWLVMGACSAPERPSSLPVPTPTPTPAPSVPRDLTVLLTGDSVPVALEARLATVAHARFGWKLVSAAVGGCSIYGDTLAWPDGTPRGGKYDCPTTVRKTQRSKVGRADPDVVIWWDRLSTMPFLTEDETFVRAGSRRFWELRTVALEKTFARLTAGGARVVFVATEPMGRGVLEFCAGWEERPCREWRRFRMRHYVDITEPMNRMMQRYAADHPDAAAFISITDRICRRNVSPCDDRFWNGIYARPDGTHYRGRGERRAAKAIAGEMGRALRGWVPRGP
jgi:SGNH domain (fused to AT3 domains)